MNRKIARDFRRSARPRHQVPLKFQKKLIFIKAYYKLNEKRMQLCDFSLAKCQNWLNKEPQSNPTPVNAAKFSHQISCENTC